MERESDCVPKTEVLEGSNHASTNIATVRRKSALASRQSRSRAASGSLKVKFDDIEDASSQRPARGTLANRNSSRVDCDTPLDTGTFALDPFRDPETPLRSGKRLTHPLHDYGESKIPRPSTSTRQVASIPELPKMGQKEMAVQKSTLHRTQRRYHTDVTKMRRAFEEQLNAVWLTEVIGDIIIKYYQGQREELVTPLTEAATTAENYDLKVLVARAQLWKALVFDETGNKSVIPEILVKILSLIRDHGDEMDCYHLRKLLPYYGEMVWQHLTKATEVKRHKSNATFTPVASQGTFQTWFGRQLSSLERRYNRTAWPDPFVAHNAALASRTLGKISLNFTLANTSGDTALIQHVMRLEDELSNEKEENPRKLQELLDENNRLRAMQSIGITAGARTNSSMVAGARPAIEDSVEIPQGQVTAMMEDLKKGVPRTRRTPQLSEKSGHSANTKARMWIEGVGKDSPTNGASTNSLQREPFATPTGVKSLYACSITESLSSVLGSDSSLIVSSARPQPWRIRNARQESNPSNATALRQSITRVPSESPVQQLSVSHNASPHTPQGFGPFSASADTPTAPAKNQQVNPMTGKESYNFATPAVPRAQARRSSSEISPLTIDPRFELASTEALSPTKLRTAFPKLEKHQAQRRRSLTISASPDSTSYETERRRSQILPGRKVEVLEGKVISAPVKALGTKPEQAAQIFQQDFEAPKEPEKFVKDDSVISNESDRHCGGFYPGSETHTDRRTNATPIDHEKWPFTGTCIISSSMFEASESEPTAYTHYRKNSAPIVSSPLRRSSYVSDIGVYPATIAKVRSEDAKPSPILNIQGLAHRQRSEISDLYGVSPHSVTGANMKASVPPQPDFDTVSSSSGSLNSVGESKQSPVRLSSLLESLQSDFPPSDYPQSERSSSTMSLLVGPLELPTITKNGDVLGDLRSALEAQQYTDGPDTKPRSLVSSHLNKMQYTVDRTINPNNSNEHTEDESIAPQESHSFHTPPHPHDTTFASDVSTSNTSNSISTPSKRTTKPAISEARTENYDINEDQVSETLLPMAYVPGSTPPMKKASPARSVQSNTTDESERSGLSTSA